MGATLRNGTHRTAFSLRFPVRRKKHLKPYLPNELKLAPMLPNAPHPHIDGRYGLQAVHYWESDAFLQHLGSGD